MVVVWPLFCRLIDWCGWVDGWVVWLFLLATLLILPLVLSTSVPGQSCPAYVGVLWYHVACGVVVGSNCVVDAVLLQVMKA